MAFTNSDAALGSSVPVTIVKISLRIDRIMTLDAETVVLCESERHFANSVIFS